MRNSEGGDQQSVFLQILQGLESTWKFEYHCMMGKSSHSTSLIADSLSHVSIGQPRRLPGAWMSGRPRESKRECEPQVCFWDLVRIWGRESLLQAGYSCVLGVPTECEWSPAWNRSLGSPRDFSLLSFQRVISRSPRFSTSPQGKSISVMFTCFFVFLFSFYFRSLRSP